MHCGVLVRENCSENLFCEVECTSACASSLGGFLPSNRLQLYLVFARSYPIAALRYQFVALHLYVSGIGTKNTMPGYHPPGSMSSPTNKANQPSLLAAGRCQGFARAVMSSAEHTGAVSVGISDLMFLETMAPNMMPSPPWLHFLGLIGDGSAVTHLAPRAEYRRSPKAVLTRLGENKYTTGTWRLTSWRPTRHPAVVE